MYEPHPGEKLRFPGEGVEPTALSDVDVQIQRLRLRLDASAAGLTTKA